MKAHALSAASQGVRSGAVAAGLAADRTRSKLGCGCSDCAKRHELQRKLELGAADDAHEREADHLADRIASSVGDSTLGAARVHVQRSVGGTPCASKAGAGGPTDPTASVERVLASPGAPLERTLRTDMERHFGHDFSRVRVHAGAEADRSARGLNARAYTLGNDIVFSSGRFAPQTPAGRRLLAHELTHVVQQAGEPRVVQRDMGFEFQTSNTVKSNKRKEFGRKFGGFLHKVPPSEKNGMEVQTDTGNVLEFETFHFQKWSDLEAQIESAVNVALQIAMNPQAFPFNNVDALKKQGKLKKDEVLEVDIDDATFSARIQANEGIALSQVRSLMDERVAPKKAVPAELKAESVLEDFNAQNKGSNPVVTGNLRGFMDLIMFYLVAARQNLTTMDRASPAKARFTLLSKTRFSAMYSSLLSQDEQALFAQIVKSGAIPKELKRSGKDPVFPDGYWGHLDGSEDWVLFDGGTVVAVAPENHKDDVHDCSSKTKTPGVDTKNCGKTMRATVVSIDGWLNSITAGGADLLSPPPHGSSSMGKKRDVDKTGTEKGLVLLESRNFEGMGFKRHYSAPPEQWVKFAEDLFQVAAACRGRKGADTELIYDGNRSPFDTKKCP